MKHIKKYNSYITEELQDMMFYPGNDYTKDMAMTLSDIVKTLKDKFKDKINSFLNSKKEYIEDKLSPIVSEVDQDDFDVLCNLLFGKNSKSVSMNDLNSTNIEKMTSNLNESLNESSEEKSQIAMDKIMNYLYHGGVGQFAYGLGGIVHGLIGMLISSISGITTVCGVSTGFFAVLIAWGLMFVTILSVSIYEKSRNGEYQTPKLKKIK